MAEMLAFVTYETPFAPCGGIAAVVKRLPGTLASASGVDTLVLSPYHHRIEKTASLRASMEVVGEPFSVGLSHSGGRVEETQVMLLRYQVDEPWPWYFLHATDKRFFAGTPNPYRVGATQDEIRRVLLRDSLLFGAAVSQALALIRPEAEWTLMLQDWETTTAALWCDSMKPRPRMFLTLHNTYDSGAVPEEQLAGQGSMDSSPGDDRTILERTLPLLEHAVFTVSHQFARDVFEDTLQVEVLADHLQEPLSPDRLRGVDNGLFAELSVPPESLALAANGDSRTLHEWKDGRRREALRALSAHEPSCEKPVWGDRQKFRTDNAPWFVFAGRDDTRQKGYDVAALALRKLLPETEARFLFFPVPGDEGLEGLTFLRELAEAHPENVLVLPFIWKKGYMAALQGATFGVMPSLYEPFGMANEFYLNGTVGIARATGGLLQQIVPLKAASAFSQAVQARTTALHLFSAKPTGILYRERDLVSTAEDWEAVNRAGYEIPGTSEASGNSRVEERSRYPLIRDMARELELALEDGVSIYREDRELYYRMLVRGIFHIRESFSWKTNAQEYLRTIRLGDANGRD